MNLIQTLLNPLAHSYAIILANYPLAICQNAEKIFIYETANYTSAIFKITNGAGAEAANTTYPYGWSTYANSIWMRAWLKPYGLYISPNGANYLKFLTFTAALIFLCEFLSNNGNNPAAWNGGEQGSYASNVAGVQNVYVV